MSAISSNYLLELTFLFTHHEMYYTDGKYVSGINSTPLSHNALIQMYGVKCFPIEACLDTIWYEIHLTKVLVEPETKHE